MVAYWYVCDYCHKEYHQMTRPKVCAECGGTSFSVKTRKSPQGEYRFAPVSLENEKSGTEYPNRTPW